VNKTEFTRRLAENLDISFAEAQSKLGLILDGLTEVLASGEDIGFAEFGKFSVRDRKARLGVNPRTGERVQIQATKVVHFTPSQKLKDLVA